MRKLFYIKIIIFLTLVSVFVIFFPVEINSTTFNLNNSKNRHYHLALLDNSNLKLELKTNCNFYSENYTPIMEIIGGPAFKIEINRKNIKIDIGHKSENKIHTIFFNRENTVPSLECGELLIYNSKNNLFTYKTNYSEFTKTKKVDPNFLVEFNRVIKLGSYREANLILVSITKLNFQKNSVSILKYLLLISSFLLYIFINIQISLNNFRYLIRTKLNIKFLIYVIILSFLTLIALPKGDDGWYLLMNKYFKFTNLYDNYVFPTPRPSGYFINALSAQIPMLDSIYLIRFLPLFFSVLCTVLLVKILNILTNRTQFKFQYYVLFFLFIYLTCFISLRPEIYITCLYLIIIYVLLKVNNQNFFDVVSLILVLFGIGSSIHQQSIILLFSSFVMIFQYIHLKPSFKMKDLATIILSIGILIQLNLFQGNFFWYINAVNTFTLTANKYSPGKFLNNYPIYSEWVRPYHVYLSGLSTQSQVFLSTIFLICCIFFIFTSLKLFSMIKYKYSNLHFLTLALSIAPFGLFLSPIKWSWYYAPLFLNIIFSYFILNFTPIYKKSYKIVLVQILVVGFSAAFAFTYDWRANDFNWPLRYISYSELNSKYWLIFGSYKSALLWVFFTLCASIAIYLLRKSSFTSQMKLLNMFTILIISTLSIIHLSPPVIDAIKNPHEWTFLKQSVVGLWDQNARCGLASTIKDQKTGKPIQQLLDENNWTVVSMPAPYIFIPCTNPVLTEAGSWLMPDVSFGWVPVYDQQRLATETDITLMGCDETLQTEDAAQRCFYKWDTKIKNLPPYTTKVIYYPDYGQILEKINPFK